VEDGEVGGGLSGVGGTERRAVPLDRSSGTFLRAGLCPLLPPCFTAVFFRRLADFSVVRIEGVMEWDGEECGMVLKRRVLVTSSGTFKFEYAFPLPPFIDHSNLQRLAKPSSSGIQTTARNFLSPARMETCDF
jgi:hypothetical protein